MAGTIMPSPKFLGLDNNADPLSGGKLYTYAAGTTTPQDTYSDVGLTTPNPNPVILDSAGRATVFLSNSSYKFVLKDSDDVTIWSQDNISTFNPTNLDIEGTAGEAVSAGDVVYLSDGSGGKTAGKWYKTDGDFDYASSLPTVALVTVAAAANASASLRIQGSYTFSSAIVAGQSYYLSATAGALATTPATYSRFFGVGAVDGFSVVFSPNPPNVVQSPTFATITATQAFILGSATTNGIRMDLSTGTMEIREGDDSAYGPLNTGALEAKGVLTVTAGTVSAPAMTTTGDTNTGVYFPAADEVAVTVNGGEELRVTASGIKPGANDGGSLGVSGTAWADLFLASGGVVDWNAGDTTLTHSAGKLTIAGSGAGALDVKGAVSPTANDGAALGSGTVSWADLFLASGGVLNFNNGDVTITHSSNTLAFAGASTAYTFADGPVSPASNDGAALGVSGTAWSDLFLASGGVINFNAGDVTITHSADTLTCAGATNYNFNDGDLTITRTSGTPTLSVVSTQAAGSAPATVGMARRGASNSATPNNSDIGIVSWAGLDSNAAYMRVAYIQASIGTNAVGGAPASLQFGTAASGASATERMRIPAAGGVQCVTTLSVGNATPASTGAGITFPAAQSASSDANTLDDYEEGTWTPTDASGAALTFTTATGSYVKIGKQVSAWGYVVYPATANASNALVGGLPFNVANEQVARGGGILAYSTETTALRAMANQNSANVTFYQSNGVAITNATCSGDTFYFCIHYYV